MLVLSRKVGEQLVIGSGPKAVTVIVTRILGNRISLGIAAPKEIPVVRGELAESRRKSHDPSKL